MKTLYFANIPTTLSTLLLVGFAVFFGLAVSRNSQIQHWGRLAFFMLVLGLFMSIFAGTKDGTGTAAALFPVGGFVFNAAAALGGLAVLVGIAMLIFRRPVFWQAAFYITSGIIILKTLLVEIARIYSYLGNH